MTKQEIGSKLSEIMNTVMTHPDFNDSITLKKVYELTYSLYKEAIRG